MKFKVIKAEEQEPKTYFDELREVAEPLGWNLTLLNNNDVEIGQYSPAGEDFSFTLNGDEDYIDQIFSYTNNFDVDDHVEMWVGGNGAPSISRLVDDARDIEQMLYELCDAVRPLLKSRRNK